ncbi:hypothetical protein 010DV004_23 [Bacillus phage 010DV004]|nr:hypothetical protein 010DV004_23 [Bacillus phage 010DV004]QZA69240.1 hypothetical protein 010DV005_23 [Bacillus phage 010DV005]
MQNHKSYKCKSYRQTLEHLNKINPQPIVVVISLWTYRSKRMTFNIPLSYTYENFDNDMNYTYRGLYFKFKTVSGKEYKFPNSDLKTVKVDCVIIAEQKQKTKE